MTRTLPTLLSLVAALFLLTAEQCPGPAPADSGPAPETPAAEARTAPATPAPATPATGGEQVVEEPAEGAPASAAALSELLGARHAEDAPTREVLDAHPDAEQALIWLAANAEALLIRARALEALGLYPSDANRTLLLGYATGDAHSKVRAAAVRALSGWPLDEDGPLVEQLTSLLTDPEVPVAIAAAKGLGGVAAARPALEAVVAAEGTPAAVVRAAEAALAE